MARCDLARYRSLHRVLLGRCEVLVMEVLNWMAEHWILTIVLATIVTGGVSRSLAIVLAVMVKR